MEVLLISASGGIILTLIGVIYSQFTSKVDKIKAIQDSCPINKMSADLASIKTDISWIKDQIKSKL